MLKRTLYATAILLSAIPLMGMKCSASAKVECRSGPCTKTGEVRGEWEWLRDMPMGDRLMALTDPFDAALFNVDISGSNVTVPTTGSVTIQLYKSATGTVLASRTFPWTRSGNIIRLADPNTVNTWAIESGGDADAFKYELAPFNTSQGDGTNTLAMADIYDGELQAAASTTWRGQVCPNDPLKERARHCPDP